MTPYHFTGQERVLEAPRDYDHASNGECFGLPVCFTDVGVMSVWKPTPEELATLHRGGGVVLHIIGGQPPVALGVVGPEQLLVPA